MPCLARGLLKSPSGYVYEASSARNSNVGRNGSRAKLHDARFRFLRRRLGSPGQLSRDSRNEPRLFPFAERLAQRSSPRTIWLHHRRGRLSSVREQRCRSRCTGLLQRLTVGKMGSLFDVLQQWTRAEPGESEGLLPDLLCEEGRAKRPQTRTSLSLLFHLIPREGKVLSG